MKWRDGLFISVFIILALVAIIAINQNTISILKTNYDEVVDLLTLCNQRVDTYYDMLVDCQELAITAQDQWEYWMDSYNLLNDQSCYPE